MLVEARLEASQDVVSELLAVRFGMREDTDVSGILYLEIRYFEVAHGDVVTDLDRFPELVFSGNEGEEAVPVEERFNPLYCVARGGCKQPPTEVDEAFLTCQRHGKQDLHHCLLVALAKDAIERLDGRLCLRSRFVALEGFQPVSQHVKHAHDVEHVAEIKLGHVLSFCCQGGATKASANY